MASSRFDGLNVDKYLGRFSGTFELEPYEADRLSADSTIVAVVVARVDGAQFRVDKRSGDVKRVNGMNVQGFAVVDDPQLRELIFQHLASLQNDAPTLTERVREDDDFVDDEPTLAPVIDLGNTTVDRDTGEVKPKDEVIVVEPDEEEVFTPGAPSRVHVGGAAKNDPVLARWLDT